jgi:O-methyltransferase involved in polyketide biosynthesis
MAAPPDGVGRTAIGIAMIRARETARPGRLFDDPYAEAFVAAAPDVLGPRPPHLLGTNGDPLANDAESVGGLLTALITIRTRFFDEYLLSAATGRRLDRPAGGDRAAPPPVACRQVVLLAAGLDTRAFRLDWPAGVRLFEVDLPEVLNFKHDVLARTGAASRCDRVAVAADLRHDWTAALTRRGFDPALPTAWLTEGLLIYLSAADTARLLTGIGALSAVGSRMATDATDCDTPMHERLRAEPGMAQVASMARGGLDEDLPGWLAARGWQPAGHDSQALAREYGHPLATWADEVFVSATRTAGPG